MYNILEISRVGVLSSDGGPLLRSLLIRLEFIDKTVKIQPTTQTTPTLFFVFLFFCFFFWGGENPCLFFGSSLESGIELKAQAAAKVGRPGTSRERIYPY